MKCLKIFPVILLYIVPTVLSAQESIIISLNKIDSVDYYVILEKNANSSELWARSQPFAKSKTDIKLATVETKIEKGTSKYITRGRHFTRENRVEAGKGPAPGSGVATIAGGPNELLPVCIVLIVPNTSMAFINAMKDDRIIIADNFKKTDFGDMKDVNCHGLMSCDLPEVAIEEALNDYSIAN